MAQLRKFHVILNEKNSDGFDEYMTYLEIVKELEKYRNDDYKRIHALFGYLYLPAVVEWSNVRSIVIDNEYIYSCSAFENWLTQNEFYA